MPKLQENILLKNYVLHNEKENLIEYSQNGEYLQEIFQNN
jgi:hypothetical protein